MRNVSLSRCPVRGRRDQQGQWRVLEDQNVVTENRKSGLCDVSAPIYKPSKKSHTKTQAKEPEGLSVPELLTPQVEGAAELRVSDTEAPEISFPKEKKRPETSVKSAEDIRGLKDVRAPKELRTSEEIRTPEQVTAPDLGEAQTLEAPALILTAKGEILEDITLSEIPSQETSDMMTPPKTEETAAAQEMTRPEVMKETEVLSSEMTRPEVKEAPEMMLITSKETLEVSAPEDSVPEIKAPVMESPKVPSLEVPDVTPSKLEAIPDVMEAQEVRATLETLVLSDVFTSEQMFISEGGAAPRVTESPKFTAGLEKMEALLPLKLAAGPERSVPDHVHMDATSNNGTETSENAEALNVMELQKLSCSEMKALKALAGDDLDVMEPEIMIMLEDGPEPNVTLTPEMEVQEMRADAPDVLCEVPMSVHEEKIISTAETPKVETPTLNIERCGLTRRRSCCESGL
ncbi:hypothetical protein KOW79_003752 [Hemibagrus wyckioides]|uniref:Uncharacterized protein n=1 Tax=Hemibagrus wyckioides TaxID=337641 RepID=A0A9D3P2W2_9TELE|nr:hypothetical protein KOW79_003752 [Hemibagrus wyckioides]